MNWIMLHWHLWIIGIIVFAVLGFVLFITFGITREGHGGWNDTICVFSLFGCVASFVAAGVSKLLLIMSFIIWIIETLAGK